MWGMCEVCYCGVVVCVLVCVGLLVRLLASAVRFPRDCQREPFALLTRWRCGVCVKCVVCEYSVVLLVGRWYVCWPVCSVVSAVG